MSCNLRIYTLIKTQSISRQVSLCTWLGCLPLCAGVHPDGNSYYPHTHTDTLQLFRSRNSTKSRSNKILSLQVQLLIRISSCVKWPNSVGFFRYIPK